MRGQRKNPRKAVQPFENKKRKIDIFKNYEANGVEKIQRKLEIFSTLISKKSSAVIAVFCFPILMKLGGVSLALATSVAVLGLGAFLTYYYAKKLGLEK